MNSSDSMNQPTHCTLPPPLLDDELLALIDGEADAFVRAHLDQCGFCAARLYDMQFVEEFLKRAMYRAGCPSADTLADYTMDLLMTRQHTAITAHLDACPRCRGEVETLYAAFDTDMEPVPKPANEPAWERVQGFLERLSSELERVLLPQPASAYQLKGSQGRTWTFASDAVSVMLSAEPVGNRLRVNGTLLDPEGGDRWTGGTVEFRAQAEARQRAVAMIDDDGMFTLALATGTYDASVYSADGFLLRLQGIEFT